MKPLLIAIDPGPHTGIAMWDDGVFNEATTLVADPDGMLEYYVRTTVLFRRATAHRSDVIVVIEDYRSQAYMTLDGYATLKLIGWLAGTARTHGCVVMTQLPAARVAFLDRAAEVYPQSSSSKHIRDAIAHGLAFMSAHPEDFGAAHA